MGSSNEFKKVHKWWVKACAAADYTLIVRSSPPASAKASDACDKTTMKWKQKGENKEEALNVQTFQCGKATPSVFQTLLTAQLICFRICSSSPLHTRTHTNYLGIQFIFGRIQYLNTCQPAVKNRKNVLSILRENKKIPRSTQMDWSVVVFCSTISFCVGLSFTDSTLLPQE